MNNCFLLISTDPHLDEITSSVELILKELMRKFRKSVDFYRASSRAVNATSEESRNVIIQKIKNSDAIILLHDINSRFYEEDYLSVSLHEHFISGKCVIAPIQKEECSLKEGLCATATLSERNVDEAVKAAITKARGRKSHITVCTDSHFHIGEYLLSRLEDTRGLNDIEVSCFSTGEFIWQYLNKIPFSDVFLTDERSLNIITTHLSSTHMFRDGFVRYRGSLCNIYAREILPYDEMTNCAFSGILLSCAAAIEDELNLPNVAAWLRRGIAIASERCLRASREDYIGEVIRRINDRIRGRRESDNDN